MGISNLAVPFHSLNFLPRQEPCFGLGATIVKLPLSGVCVTDTYNVLSRIEDSSDVFKFWLINVGVSAHVCPDGHGRCYVKWTGPSVWKHVRDG